MLAAATKQTTQAVPIPAPMGGINAQDNLMEMSGGDAVSLLNLIPQTYGLEIRKGYIEWARGFAGPATEIRTLIPYEGSTSAEDRLFCATVDGIYNITASGSTFTRVLSWPSATGDAGDCSFELHTGIGGRFILLCDEVNGYYQYSETTGLWAVVTTITGAVSANFRHVSVWKSRAWFVDAANSTAYYLATGAITGAATAFYFGNKFPNGGVLRSLHSFTHDGGNGPDDYLIALSSSGDLVVYQGTDPSDADKFGVVGSWNVGSIPSGRKLAESSGGDLYLLCGMGLISVAQLLRGADPGVAPAYVTGKVTSLVRGYLTTRKAQRGWFVLSVPTEGILLIGIPEVGSDTGVRVQFAMNLATRAWTVLNGLPMRCAATWKGDLYMGRVADAPAYGQVSKYSGKRDNVLLSDPEGGDAVAFSLLSAYKSDQAGGAFRRGHFIRPQFLATGVPVYETEVRYDFELREPSAISGVVTGGSLVSLWGSPTVWGDALWGGGRSITIHSITGATGMGRYIAVALSGRTLYGGTLLGFTILYDAGGLL